MILLQLCKHMFQKVPLEKTIGKLVTCDIWNGKFEMIGKKQLTSSAYYTFITYFCKQFLNNMKMS